MENCCVAPPGQNTTWWSSGTASSARRFATVSSTTSRNHGLRCEISSGDTVMPARHEITLSLLENRTRKHGRPGREVEDAIRHVDDLSTTTDGAPGSRDRHMSGRIRTHIQRGSCSARRNMRGQRIRPRTLAPRRRCTRCGRRPRGRSAARRLDLPGLRRVRRRPGGGSDTCHRHTSFTSNVASSHTATLAEWPTRSGTAARDVGRPRCAVACGPRRSAHWRTSASSSARTAPPERRRRAASPPSWPRPARPS